MANPKIPRREIARLTAQAFGVKLEDLCSDSRARRHAQARWAAWMLVRELRPSTSLKELGNLLDKDHSTAVTGLVRAKELLDLNREFRDRIEAARKSIAEWRPAPPVMVSLAPPAAPLAIRAETRPAAVSVALTPKPKSNRECHYETWRRESCLSSEARFLDIAMREFPHLVRVPQKEAAE